MTLSSIPMGLRRSTPWLAWVLTRAFGIAAVYALFVYGLPGVFGTSADVTLYGGWGWFFQHGCLPYRCSAVVYPPGVLPFLVIPAPSSVVYQVEFLGLALMADGYVFHRLRRAGLRGGSWLWLLGALLLGPIFWTRLDLFLAVALVLAVLEWNRERPERAALWIGFAASLKVWPILLLLPLLLVLRGRRRVGAAGCGLIVPVALVLPVAVWGGLPGLWDAVRLQSGRGVEVESVFALPLELARTFNLSSVVPVESMSWEFDGHAGSVLGVISTLVLLVGVVGWLALVARRRQASAFPLGHALLLLSAVLVCTAKALSPQYALWVLAGVVVFDNRIPRRLVVSTAAFLVTTQALFPFAFGGLITDKWPSTALAVLHAAAVLGLLMAAGAALPPETPSPELLPAPEVATGEALTTVGPEPALELVPMATVGAP